MQELTKTAQQLRSHIKTAQWWRNFMRQTPPPLPPQPSLLRNVAGMVGKAGKFLVTPSMIAYLLGNAGVNAYGAYTGDRRPLEWLNEMQTKATLPLMGGSSAAGNFIGDYLKTRDFSGAKQRAYDIYGNISSAADAAKEFMNNANFIGGMLKDTLVPATKNVAQGIAPIASATSSKLETAADTIKNLRLAAGLASDGTAVVQDFTDAVIPTWMRM